MKTPYPPCIYAETLLELPSLTDTDVQVAEQYLPMVANYYHQSLLLKPEALDYLATNYGISQSIAAQYNIGFANRSLGLELPDRKESSGQILRGSLGRLRLFKGSGHEAFCGCIVIPIMTDDIIVGFYAERIGRPRRGAKSCYWVPLSPPCLFQSECCLDRASIYLCSSPLLAIQISQVTQWATLAANLNFHLYDADYQYLVDAGVKEVIVVMQPDTAAEDLRKLGHKLKMFGLRYQKINSMAEVAYGTA
jgi:hypothetical protein